MGMAASQARFLSLVARKNNVEYEGQQINQQRTALSNKTANYYSDLLGMSVPVCPSVEDFTQTVYSFTDGALTNSITSLIAQGDGSYKASYLCSYTDDFAIVAAGATSVVNTATGDYMVGANKLKPLGQDLEWAHTIREGFSEYRLTENENGSFSYTDINNRPKTIVPLTEAMIETIVGPKPLREDYQLNQMAESYKNSACYSQVNPYKASNSLYPDSSTHAYHIEHNLCRLVWTNESDEPGMTTNSSVTSSSGITITRKGTGLTYYSLTGNTGGEATNKECIDLRNVLQTRFPDTYQKVVDIYVDALSYARLYNSDASKYSSYADIDMNGVSMSEDDEYVKDLLTRWEALWAEIGGLVYNEDYERDLAAWEAAAAPYVGKYTDADDFNAGDYTKIYTISEDDKKMFYDGNDEYIKSLSSDQLEKLYETEVDFKDLLNEKVCTPDSDWYVRYVQNSATGEWEPTFYNGDDIANGIADEYSNVRSSIQAYKLGSKQVQNEIKGRDAVIEQDSTGRYINITFVDENGAKSTYALSISTVTDNDAYNDAMNQYEYDKAIYDQNIEKINAKIAIIQSEDKNLELRLKQLDTEHNALSNEMDAVQKVIEKNVESGFKTFG